MSREANSLHFDRQRRIYCIETALLQQQEALLVRLRWSFLEAIDIVEYASIVFADAQF